MGKPLCISTAPPPQGEASHAKLQLEVEAFFGPFAKTCRSSLNGASVPSSKACSQRAGVTNLLFGTRPGGDSLVADVALDLSLSVRAAYMAAEKGRASGTTYETRAALPTMDTASFLGVLPVPETKSNSCWMSSSTNLGGQCHYCYPLFIANDTRPRSTRKGFGVRGQRPCPKRGAIR
jgi:hypothetical protein